MRYMGLIMDVPAESDALGSIIIKGVKTMLGCSSRICLLDGTWIRNPKEL